MYTLCTINEEPLQAETYPKLKSITHLCTFSDIGVYVALQLILIIVVSDQWYRVLIPYSCRQAPWALLHALGWFSQYMCKESHERCIVSNFGSHIFTLYNYSSTTRI